MTEMLEQQSTAFAVCVLFGAGIGLIIGLFNAFKKVINIKDAWIGFIDLLFWLVLCATVIWTTFTYNSGVIRLYIFFWNRTVFFYYKLGCFQTLKLYIV